MPANPKAGKALLRRLPMEERFGMAQFSLLPPPLGWPRQCLRFSAGNANLSERDFEALVSIYDRCNDYVTFWSLYSKIVPVNPPSGCEASAYPYDARNRRT
jgi:hypothetical protein